MAWGALPPGHTEQPERRHAAGLPLARPSLSLTPKSGPPTTSVEITGTGFAPNEAVEVYFDEVDVDTWFADSSGALEGVGLQVPVSAVPGLHWLTVMGLHRGPHAQAPFEVTAAWRQLGFRSSGARLNPYENLITPTTAKTLFEVGQGHAGGAIQSSPAIVAGEAFVGSDDGTLSKFPAAGCAKPACGPTWSASTGGPITSSPAVARRVVYVGSQDGVLYAFRTACSVGPGPCLPLWRGRTAGPITSSPAVSDEVYVGSDDGDLHAFAPGGCGRSWCPPVWSSPTGGAIRSSPSVAGGRVFVGSGDGSLYAFDAKTGAPVWVGATGGPVTSSPAIAGTVVYVGSEDGNLYAFETGCGSAGSACSPLWTGLTGGEVDSSPAVAYRDVFVGSADGTVYAFPASGCGGSTCPPLWTGSTGGAITASPAVAGGVVLVGSTDGTLYGFNARSGALIWSEATGSPIISSPAVSDGLVVVGTESGALEVFGVRHHPAPPPRPAPKSLAPFSTPIRHVIVIYEENHSFDNLLGALCVQDNRCDGTTSGKLPDGTQIPLAQAPDVVPLVDHGVAAQALAIAGGAMDGFANITGCDASTGYACYTQYQPSQIPAEAALARTFAISDATFEDAAVPSWGAHLDLVTAQLDGFTGDNPVPPPSGQGGRGWGCDSGAVTPWSSGGQTLEEPSCVPRPDGSGPFPPSPVPWVPSIMDRLDDEGQSWRIYAGGRKVTGSGYVWASCPTLADCIYGPQVNDLVPSTQVLADAVAGALPAFGIVQPSQWSSQHNGYSMAAGDNWVASVVSAIEGGPQWPTTAIFITEDDCGCFYDHVPPPPGFHGFVRVAPRVPRARLRPASPRTGGRHRLPLHGFL